MESVEDVLDELGAPATSRAGAAPDHDVTGKARLSEPADTLLPALGYDPVTLDALCERSGQPPEAVAARLLELELAGVAERLPGNLFRRLG
ncbi:hypothetical protein D3C87_2000660 [compost metagenome]